MSRPLAPKGGNDKIYTPLELARQIVQHFQPGGLVCEPCKGAGAFTNALEELPKDPLAGLPAVGDYLPGYIFSLREYEIDEGNDFLKAPISPGYYHWVITNPPWSQLRAFLRKSMEVSDNIVFLCLVNAFFMKARQRDMQEAGFGMKEILFVPTPPKPWPQTGFSLGAVHIERGYKDDLKLSHL